MRKRGKIFIKKKRLKSYIYILYRYNSYKMYIFRIFNTIYTTNNKTINKYFMNFKLISRLETTTTIRYKLSLSLYDDIDGHIGFSFVSSSTFSSSLFSIFNNNHNHHHHIIVIIANIIYIYILLNFYFDKLFSFFFLSVSLFLKEVWIL